MTAAPRHLTGSADARKAQPLKNMPVLIITGDGTRQLCVFPDLEGGRCTGRTTRAERCGNPVWEHGQAAGYTTVFAGDRAVGVYGPLEGAVADRYLAQRCRTHAGAEAAWCDPEWERFDVARHREMTSAPTAAAVFTAAQAPPVEVLAAVLRDHLLPSERRRLAELLTGGQDR